MFILAMTIPGKEFIYKANTAHQVSKASAETICNVCNENKYMYSRYPGYKWHVYEIDKYAMAADYASYQKFTIYKGLVKAKYF